MGLEAGTKALLDAGELRVKETICSTTIFCIFKVSHMMQCKLHLWVIAMVILQVVKYGTPQFNFMILMGVASSLRPWNDRDSHHQRE